MRRVCGILAALSLSSSALAEVDPKCEGLPIPDDYDEQVQQDFQANYYALTASYSSAHGPIPHKPGTGMIGVAASVMPPLGCERRFVLNWTKTEDTNKSPLLPRLQASYAFPAIKDIAVPYASIGFLPPIPISGTRNMVVSGEFGFGFYIHKFFEAGFRGHANLQRTYGDIATAFDPETEPVVEDAYVASTWGIDVLLGVPLDVGQQHIVPFASIGYLDASTFFFVGDSSFAANNLHPYSGLALSVGVDMLFVKHLRLGVEFYAAPGGYSLPDPSADSVDQASRYGSLYTARGRIGYEF
jgi:hypothetical protein